MPRIGWRGARPDYQPRWWFLWLPRREFIPQPPCRSQKVIEGVGLAVVVEPCTACSIVGSLLVSQAYWPPILVTS